jgi:lactoylglutathione lyase
MVVGSPQTTVATFGLVVDDKEAARKALEAAGVTLIEGPFLDFRDPWGTE